MDLRPLEYILRKHANEYPDILGIILLGSCVIKKPKICDLSLSGCFSSLRIEHVYDALQANVCPKMHAPQDVDIWLLVKESNECPEISEIDWTQQGFLEELVSTSNVTAHRVGQLKEKYFSRYYKQTQYYTGYLECEELPWNGGSYTEVVKSDIRNQGIRLPRLEVRAFPAPVFHVRPHALICGGYYDRLPMAFNLKNWLTTEPNYRVIYKTEQANIWPLSEMEPPLGSKVFK